MNIDGIELPADMVWLNEYEWTPVQQSVRHTLSGALVLESGVKLAGRPMRLAGSYRSSVWATRATVEALYAKLAAATEMAVTVADGRAFVVVFDHGNNPLIAPAVGQFAVEGTDEKHELELNFLILRHLHLADGSAVIGVTAAAECYVGP